MNRSFASSAPERTCMHSSNDGSVHPEKVTCKVVQAMIMLVLLGDPADNGCIRCGGVRYSNLIQRAAGIVRPD